MRPLFTIHAGEYLVGLQIRHKFPDLNLWIPAKDTGIDLLVTDRENRRTVSLQVKYGKDFLPEKSAKVQKELRCLSWFKVNTNKFEQCPAELWVFVLHSFKSDEPDFIIIPKNELRRRMTEIHGWNGIIQTYMCSTERNFSWEVRIKRHDYVLGRIADGDYEDSSRDFTKYLNGNGWPALTNRLNQ